MKLGGPDTLKFKKLRMRLGFSHWQAVGLLESIWMFTQRNAPQGDIGRHSNEDIAAAIEWPNDPDELVQTLVDCRWLDPCEDCRFVIHDWADHAPNWLLGNLAKHKKPIKIGISAKQKPIEHVTKQATRQLAKQTPLQIARDASR